MPPLPPWPAHVIDATGRIRPPIGTERPSDRIMDKTIERDDTDLTDGTALDDVAPASGASQRMMLIALVPIMIGAVLRLAVYLDALPFRVDELRLAANLFERSFAELTRPLDHAQTAPIGYLWLQKLALLLPGSRELTLRLISLVAGIASLYLFYVVGRRVTRPLGMLFALTLMALSPILLLRSSDLKQYSLDGMLTIAMVALALPLLERYRRRRMIWLGVFGAAALLLSHSALFVAGSTALTLVFFGWTGHHRSLTRAALVTGAAWGALALVIYVIHVHDMQANPAVTAWFAPDFMPLPRSFADLLWFARAFDDLFASAGITQVGIAAILFLLGLRALVPDRWPLLSMLVLPIVLALLASALQRYPFTGRLLTFAVPLVLLLTAIGFQALTESLVRYRWLVAGLAALILFVAMADQARRLPRWSGGRYDMVRILEHTKRHARPDDVILVSGAIRFPYDYYAGQQGITNETHFVELPVAEGDTVAGLDLDRLEGRRAWVVMPHSHIISRGRSGDPRPATRATLDTLATWLDVVRGANVSISLYEFDR
jgi:uncharacterized membrane protein